VKRLVLMRHAKSSWDEPATADHDRPLSARGLRDAPHMGERLAQRGIRPDLVLTSTAERARRTAALVERALDAGTLPTVTEARIYMASPAEILAVMNELDDAYGDVLVIGHNPGMTALVNLLLPHLELDNLPTAGVVAVDCEEPSWRELASARHTLRFYDYPKNRAAAC
jgi:phosphohistidine phosphatase